MYFKKLVLAGFATLLMALPAAAQDWQVSSSVDQGWFFAGTGTDGGPISFGCAGHYPGADWSYGEGGGPYDPYLFNVGMTEALGPIDWSQPNAGRRSDVVFSIGGAGYLFPEIQWNDMTGEWSLSLSMGDPLVTALLAGGDSELWAGQTLIASLPGAGLASAVAQVIRFCDGHWSAMGAALPAHAAPTVRMLRGQGG